MTDYVRVVNDHCLARKVIVSPGMCSGGSLIYSRIGDWTWEAVAAACRTNVHAARTPNGQPAYLSFYYYRVRGGKIVHPHDLTFGDELQVTSRVFQFGSHSVLTLHRLAPVDLDLADTLDPAEVYELAASGLHVRGEPQPLDFAQQSRYQSGPCRGRTCRFPLHASTASAKRVLATDTSWPGTRGEQFLHPRPTGLHAVGPEQAFEYELDVTRDINGAGLVYFASYFSIFDSALLRLWRSLGCSDEQFLHRRVIDQKVGYFGNADPGAVFVITVRRWQSSTQPEIEIADMALRDSVTDALLAVTAIETERYPANCSVALSFHARLVSWP